MGNNMAAQMYAGLTQWFQFAFGRRDRAPFPGIPEQERRQSRMRNMFAGLMQFIHFVIGRQGHAVDQRKNEEKSAVDEEQPSEDQSSKHEQKHRQTEVAKNVLHRRENWKADYEDLHERFKAMQLQLQDTERAKKELRLRLSELAGARLLENNPNITDLSDQDRATKLAEKFSELYDNEWTNAFTNLTEICNLSEENAIATLLSILENIFIFCKRYSEEKWTALDTAIIDFVGQGAVEDIKTLENRFRNTRKRHADAVLNDSLLKNIQTNLETEEGLNQELLVAISKTGYVEKCGSLCWKMVIQDPPLFLPLTCKQGEEFDKALYKAYTRTGDSIEYVVWPSLCLMKGGPVLCKGVAQAQTKHKEDEDESKDNTQIDMEDIDAQISEKKPLLEDTNKEYSDQQPQGHQMIMVVKEDLENGCSDQNVDHCKRKEALNQDQDRSMGKDGGSKKSLNRDEKEVKETNSDGNDDTSEGHNQCALY